MTQTDWQSVRQREAEFCEDSDPVARPCGHCPGCVGRERQLAAEFEAELAQARASNAR